MRDYREMMEEILVLREELKETEEKRDCCANDMLEITLQLVEAKDKLSEALKVVEGVRRIQKVLEQPIDRMDALGVRKVAEMINSIPLPKEDKT